MVLLVGMDWLDYGVACQGWDILARRITHNLARRITHHSSAAVHIALYIAVTVVITHRRLIVGWGVMVMA